MVSRTQIDTGLGVVSKVGAQVGSCIDTMRPKAPSRRCPLMTEETGFDHSGD